MMTALSSEQALELAEQLLQIGESAEVIRLCRAILAEQPDHQAALARLSKASFVAGRIAGFRINLDSRADRMAQCRDNEAQYQVPDGALQRLPAVADAAFGAVGCGKSHLLALTRCFTEHSSAHCLVLEDDFDFLRPLPELIATLEVIERIGLSWDVLMLTGNDVVPIEQIHAAPCILRILEAQSGAGYLVNRAFLPRLISCFADAIAQLERFRGFQPRTFITSRFAIDMAWKSLQRQGHWYICNPSFGHQRAGHSDIEGMFKDYSRGTFYRYP